MRALALLLCVAAGVGGTVGYLVTGQRLLLVLGAVGVALASGGYVLARDTPRRRRPNGHPR